MHSKVRTCSRRFCLVLIPIFQKLSVADALLMVAKARSIICPNYGAEKQILSQETHLSFVLQASGGSWISGTR
jgi:hypothetical protein